MTRVETLWAFLLHLKLIVSKPKRGKHRSLPPSPAGDCGRRGDSDAVVLRGDTTCVERRGEAAMVVSKSNEQKKHGSVAQSLLASSVARARLLACTAVIRVSSSR